MSIHTRILHCTHTLDIEPFLDKSFNEIYEPCDSEITEEEDETAIENKYVLVEWDQLKMLFTRCLCVGENPPTHKQRVNSIFS